MTYSLDELSRYDREHVWHAFTQRAEYEPFIIERASGCTLVDVHGREYIDGVSSIWCNVHGHRHEAIDEALRQQIDLVAHVTALGMSNPTTITLAKRLVDITPDGLNHVFFSSDGSSAVEVALKMSFQYWQQRESPKKSKTRYIALTDAYHGDTLGSASVGGIARFHQMFHPLLFDVLRLPIPHTYRLPPGVVPEQACGYYLNQLEHALQQHHETIAAVVVEPLVQCAAGMITHPAGYLRGVRALTEQFGVLMIADEVAVGFGRTGRMFACEHEQVAPDLLCLGKGLTGGYLPMAATLTSDEVAGAFHGSYEESKTFFHGHTFGGNPLCAAAALASLDVFETERTLSRLPEKCNQLRQGLASLADLDCVGDIRQKGLIVGIELVRDRATRQPYDWTEQRGLRVCQAALERGVWLRPLGNVVVIMPPLSVSSDQLDQICQSVIHGIDLATR